MFTPNFKWHFIPGLIGLLTVLCMLSTTSYGQGEIKGPPPTPSTMQPGANLPSIEQTLVPESVFAMELAKALNLAPAPNEAKAEELLSGLGIEPKNGWISEYPVTPAVLGDVDEGISLASEQRKIAFSKDQAVKIVDGLKARLGFNVNSDPNAPPSLIKSQGNTKIYIYTDSKGVIHYTDKYDSIPKEFRGVVKIISQSTPHELTGAGSGTTEALGPQSMANPPPDVINDYYYEQGPPVVTYYSQPDPYYYLYSWIPYPFWSTGFYFPGFFVLNNFHRHVFINRHHHFVAHHNGGGAFHHPLGAGPVNRSFSGHLTPEGMASSRWFSAPNALAGAKAIITLNQNRNRSINGTGVSGMNVSRPRLPFSSSEHSTTFNNAPAVLNDRATKHNGLFRPAPDSGGGRIFNHPAFNHRTEIPNTPRFSSPHTFTQNRVFRSPRPFGESAAERPHSGGGGGEFHHGGNFTSHGGNFPGASRGGHR